MKKMLLIISIILTLFFSGLSSAISMKITDNAENNHMIEESTQLLKIEFPKTIKNSPQAWDWYSFTEKHGIKIWACGWGTFNCKVIDGDYPFYRFIDGDTKDDETWRIDIWASHDYNGYYNTNSFNYNFYNNDAETRTNALITNFPFIVLLLEHYKPGTADKFRRNSKIPFIGTGSHELSKGLLFCGTVTKGQTYEGEPRSMKMVDTDGDGVDDTECYYYEIVARSTYLYHTERNEDLSPLELLKISLSRLLWWKDPNYIPYEI